MIRTPKETLKIFYSYAHEDQEYRNQLDRHLSNLKRLYNLETWFDRQIRAGDNWEAVLEENLNTADLIFLLISPDFMHSNYCYNKEMARALERHAKGEAKVIPVIVRRVHWTNAPFSHIQLLPTNTQPIRSWTDPDDAFYDVVVEIEKVIQDLLNVREAAETEKAFLRERVLQEEKKAQVVPILLHPIDLKNTPVEGLQAIPTDAKPATKQELQNDAFLDITEHPRQTISPIQQTRPQQSFVSPHSHSSLSPLLPPPSLRQMRKKLHYGGKRRIRAIRVFIIALIVLVLAGGLSAYLLLYHPQPPQSSAYKDIQSVKLDDGEDLTIGISDGSYPFIPSDAFNTTNDSDNYHWPQTANSETCIHDVNQQIGAVAHVTVVAVVSLSETKTDKYSLGLGNATLQGFCLEQWTYNQTHTPKVRILIANIGVQEANDLQRTMPTITGKIIALKSDPTFIGAVGFTFSASLDIPGGYDTMTQLKNAGIPVISTAAATSTFCTSATSTSCPTFGTMWPGYFYRMNPGNDVEARVAAYFAYTVKQKKTALVFYNKDSSYSASLEKNFSSTFQSLAGPESVEPHNIDVDNDFQTPLQDFVNSHKPLPDMIFCACVASGGTSPDFSKFSQALQSIPTFVSALTHGTIMLMGADGLYNPEGLGITYNNMYFTALAFPDMVTRYCTNNSDEGCTPEMMSFNVRYCNRFAKGIFNTPEQAANETLSPNCKAYGVSRPSKSTMLAYDALTTLLSAFDLSSASAHTAAPLLDQIHRALPNVAFQGITGWIQFDRDGKSANPVHKAIVVIYVNGTHGQIVGYCGEFTPKLSTYAFDPQQKNC